jgi:hypothetical protein
MPNPDALHVCTLTHFRLADLTRPRPHLVLARVGLFHSSF